MKALLENGPKAGEVMELVESVATIEVPVAGPFGEWAMASPLPGEEATVRPVDVHVHRYERAGGYDDGTVSFVDFEPDCGQCCQHETCSVVRTWQGGGFLICDDCGEQRGERLEPESERAAGYYWGYNAADVDWTQDTIRATLHTEEIGQ